MKITEKTTVPEVLKLSKNTLKVFKKYNLDCLECKGSLNETLDKVAVNNGLEINTFIEELKKAAEEK